MTDDTRFADAVARFAAIHAGDPALDVVDGVPRAREQVQAERLARWVERLAPKASTALRLASHCQHIGRYRVPRSSYPADRIGYLKWRTDLARMHADTAQQVLEAVGYEAATIEQVRHIVQKQGLRLDPEVQTMEDALCLTFLEHEFAEFAEKHDDEKLVTIVQKTWRKMSPRAREIALTLPLSGRPLELVKRALDPARQHV